MESSNRGKKLIDKVKSLPQVPGSYIFKDKNGVVIYVGKAINLRSRVGSYFRINFDRDSKTAALVEKINDISFVEVGSEFEALILEAELIRKHRPRYNIVLKDDKSSLYIVIRNDFLSIAGKKIALRKIITARKTELQKKDIVFGPFPNSNVTKNILGTIRKVVPFRDCSLGKFTRHCRLQSPCLYGHLGLCQAPCLTIGDVSSYRKSISYAKKILSGRTTLLIKQIKSSMEKLSKQQEFEKAALQRDLLEKFGYLSRSFRSAEEYINNPYLVEDITKKALSEIKDFLHLDKEPTRIECYDISNISGKEAVGSMVVATEGKVDKKQYRRFKVKFIKTPSDFEMMHEVLSRRFKRVSSQKKHSQNWLNPDLVVVDGGVPQVSSAASVFEELGIEVFCVGLAKKHEMLVMKSKDSYKEIFIPKDNEGLKLLIRLRDESHRFAQRYHHLLRSKALGV